MLTEKICRGTGRALGFGCGLLVPVVRYGQANRIYGLGKSCECYMKWILNTPEGKEQVQKSTLKATEPRRSLEKAEKQHKETNGIQAALTLTKTVVHEMVRLRDKGKPCVSCDAEWEESFQACHCYPTRYRSIRFHFHNVNGGCCNCNLFLDGNETEYLIKLPNRIGQDNFDSLKKLAELDGKFNKHWTKTELSNIRKEARNMIKELNK